MISRGVPRALSGWTWSTREVLDVVDALVGELVEQRFEHRSRGFPERVK
jgi:hypothetical protein